MLREWVLNESITKFLINDYKEKFDCWNIAVPYCKNTIFAVYEIRFIKEFGFMLAMGHSGELRNGLKL